MNNPREKPKTMADEDEENEILVCNTSEELDRLQKEVILVRQDFFILRMIIVCIVTFLFTMLFMQISRRDRNSYEMLHSILEEIEPLRMREFKQIYVRPDWTKFEASEHWAWDSERETLKVNTSIYVR